ncbi:MAG: NfeD family protein [Oscillospiraceae bacterium]|nr:NfeD family protein [Oscillospiraceae bacterium]
MNWAAFIWLVLFILFLMAEASTVVVISLWFAVGALTAMIASLLGAELWLQAVLFAVVSIVLLCALRPIVRKYFTPKLTKTNVDALVGTSGLVTEKIDNTLSRGRVKLGAMEWTARSTSGETVEVGTLVRVDRIEGVKVFVTPVEVTAQVK